MSLDAVLGERFRSKRVWMPFYYDGACAEHLRQIGFTHVVHEQKDFFEQMQDKAFLESVDVVIDNPPYTGEQVKVGILKALAQWGKPFVLLLPSSVLFAQYLRESLDMSKVQAIFPRRVLVRKSGQEQVAFKYLIWLCYDCELERDMMFTDQIS